MKKIILTLFCSSILFSCNNDSNEYEKNLDHFQNLVKDINTNFIDSTQDILAISDYSSSMKVFANENKIGLFQKSTQTSMLLNNFLVNKVHDFINYDDN